MKIDAEIDIASLERQFKKTAKRFGDTQVQAQKRWGVFTARKLAEYTVPLGKKGAKQKENIARDALKVVIPYTGRTKKSAKGVTYTSRGGHQSFVAHRKFTTDSSVVVAWLGERKGNKGSPSRMPPHERLVCSQTVLNKAVNYKYKTASGIGKDGWLDAGDHISKRQKMGKPAKIGVSFMKWSRKTRSFGTSKGRRRILKTSSELISHVSYINKIISKSSMRNAVRHGGRDAIKWYKRVMQAEAKKKRPR